MVYETQYSQLSLNHRFPFCGMVGLCFWLTISGQSLFTVPTPSNHQSRGEHTLFQTLESFDFKKETL